MGEKMAAEKFRAQFEKVFEPLVSKLGFVNPNHLTWSTLLLALGAAWLYINAGRDSQGGWMLLGAIGLMMLASLFDGLDGQIARTYGKASDYGDFLDHTIDRVVDIILLVAIGLSSAWLGDDVWLGYSAALLTLMGSYMGTQAQSVGLGRNYGGFSRADRLSIIMLATLVAAIQSFRGMGDFAAIDLPTGTLAINPLSAVLLISAAGGAYTFLVRFFASRKGLLARLSASLGGDSEG